jgi:hypothetical protein
MEINIDQLVIFLAPGWSSDVGMMSKSLERNRFRHIDAPQGTSSSIDRQVKCTAGS